MDTLRERWSTAAGIIARYALHEDVVGPARANVEELDDVVGRTDRLGLDVRRVPVAGEEALEDGAPRGQLGALWAARTGFAGWGAGACCGRAPGTGRIELKSSVKKAAKSPVAVGIGMILAPLLALLWFGQIESME